MTPKILPSVLTLPLDGEHMTYANKIIGIFTAKTTQNNDKGTN